VIFPDNEATRLKAAELIKSGGVIAFRTDTFYGLGVDPFNGTAVERIKQLKGREDNKPILLLISDRSQLGRVIESRSEAFDLLAREFWPGPLTIIGRAVDSLTPAITSGSGTVGVRLPGEESVGRLVEICGGLLTATSANPSGQAPAENAKQVDEYFAEGIELIIDGGAVQATQASTVVEATDGVRIVREGAVSKADLERAIGASL